MSPLALRNRPPRRSMGGFSLVELMISIVLGLLIMAALVSIFANTSAARSELERTSRQIENGRFAMELLSDDLRVAGFYGELNVSQFVVPGGLPDPCSTNVSDWAAAIPISVQGYDNGTSAPSCVPSSLKAGTDVVVIRRTETCEIGGPGCDAGLSNLPFFQVSKCSAESVATPYAIGMQGSPDFTLKLKDCATLAGMRKYLVHIYFISTDNGQGVAMPTLKRLEFNGNTYTEMPLVEGIEELNIEYGIDKDGDGSPDAYTTDPTNFTYAGCTTCTAPRNWSNVMTARINLLARNIETSPNFTDTKTYSLGLDSTGTPITVTPGGSVRRHVYTGLVRLVNPSSRREKP
jgi:Tfp pilus assembly protein PilW